jgi:hypothetical protein
VRARLVQPAGVRDDARHPRHDLRRWHHAGHRHETGGEADRHAAFDDAADQVTGVVDAVGTPERHVLDAAHAGVERRPDRGGAVGVRGHRQAEPVRLVDERPQVLPGELREFLAGARRHRPAAGHHLDDVGAAIGPLAFRRPLSGRLRRSSSAEEVAVARRRGDRRPGRDDRRQSGGAPQPQPQPQREIVTVAEVANRREPS